MYHIQLAPRRYEYLHHRQLRREEERTGEVTGKTSHNSPCNDMLKVCKLRHKAFLFFF